LPVDPGYTTWCERCGWNVRPDQSPAAPNAIVRAYETLGRRQSQRLFDDLLRQPALKRTLIPSDLAAFVIAALVHSLTLVCVALGIAVSALFWPNLIGILLGSPLFVLAWVLAPRLPPSPDIILDRHEFPALYALADAVADALGTARVAGIAFDMEFNAAFGRAGWRRRNILHLGLPFWAILDDDERVALVAHELAHGANRDFDRGFLVGGAITTLHYWCRILTPPEYVSGGVVALGMFLLRCLSLIPRCLRFILAHLRWRGSQRAEYLADHCAATVGGTAAVLSLLGKLHFERDYRLVREWVAQGYKRASLFDALRQRVTWVPPRELERLHRVAQASAARLDVTHPPVANRIALLKARPAAPLASIATTLDRRELQAETTAIEEVFERELVTFYDEPWRWG
jgi:Zn-dependent protease with chaperone function